MQRAERAAGSDRLVGGAGCLARSLFVQHHDCVDRGVQARDALQVVVEQFAARQLLAGQRRDEARRRREREVAHVALLMWVVFGVGCPDAQGDGVWLMRPVVDDVLQADTGATWTS
ncbi:hypothetical protein OHN37_33225 [Streptomyces sp. NBC_00485]|uniref:hypothetical protein n=1 Tax=unclassified Streptomyces TaxID=2593676 RepID=UPI002E17ECB1